MSPDTRPLAERVRALANRFDAMAIGAEKLRSAQVAENHRRDARTLHDAAEVLKETARARKREALRELTRLTEEYGGYEELKGTNEETTR